MWFVGGGCLWLGFCFLVGGCGFWVRSVMMIRVSVVLFWEFVWEEELVFV